MSATIALWLILAWAVGGGWLIAGAVTEGWRRGPRGP